MHFIAPTDEVNPLSKREDFSVIPESIAQYTGIEDTRGQKIFEDDIVEVYHNSSIIQNYLNNHIITFKDGVFIAEELPYGNDSSLNRLHYYELELKVIGNKFENPELLK